MMLMMRGIRQTCRRLRDEDGMSMIEYGVLGAFVIAALVAAAVTIGPQLQNWIINTVNDIISGTT